MTTKTEIENLKTSGAEKVLAGVLTIFILIGAIWAYDQIGHISSNDDFPGYLTTREQNPKDTRAVRDYSRARTEVFKAKRTVQKATKRLEITREAYRTELEADSAAISETQAAYQLAQASRRSAIEQLKSADRKAASLLPAEKVAREHIAKDRQEARADTRNKDRIVAGVRLALVLAMLAFGYFWLRQVRRTRSRLLPLALAEISAAAGLAVFMAADYGSELEAFQNAGPLAISIIGIVITVAAFVGLQRYLAKLIPQRRVRRHECPFCGYPVRDNEMCEGCGRTVKGDCATCDQPRRVGTTHCGACGAS